MAISSILLHSFRKHKRENRSPISDTVYRHVESNKLPITETHVLYNICITS